MKGRIISLGIIVLMMIGTFGANANQQIKQTLNSIEYVPGEVIIGFYNTVNVKNINSLDGLQIKNKINELNVAVLQVERGKEQFYIERLSYFPDVKYTELNVIYQSYYTPNDPRWNEQWGPQRIHCTEAWDSGTGSSAIRLVIVDSGVDYNHEDISGNWLAGGYDFVNNDNNPMDDFDHGTHCAGIAAAVINNNKGIAGVADVTIMAEKVLDSTGHGTSDKVAQGIMHAADTLNADVISLSLGSDYYSQTLENACNHAYNDKGVVIVAASGNDGASQVSYPAAYDSVIAVGAINQNDQRCSFSNYGSDLELVAPGDDILSTIRNNQYSLKDGTSMACPHVAGVAALALSKNPSQNNVGIRYILTHTAEDLGSSGWDQYYGYGLVDARLTLVTKYGDQYSASGGQVVLWPPHGVELSENWWPEDIGWASYVLDIGDKSDVTDTIKIGVEIKDESANGDGPFVYAKNVASGNWEQVGNEFPISDVLTWYWSSGISTNSYVTNSGTVEIKVYAEATDDICLDEVGVDYELKPLIPDLDCEGSLSWSKIEPGSTVTGSFTVCNKGDSGSELNWEVVSWPNWGTWTFTPKSGSSLSPEDGKKTINVVIKAPNEKKKDFTGTIKVVNTGNSGDYDTISVSLSTPKNKSLLITIFANLFEKFPFLKVILNFLLNIK